MNCAMTSSTLMDSSYAALRTFHRDVLIGGRVGKQRNPAEAGFADPRADTVDEGDLPDRPIDRALDHELLNLEQHGLALGAIQLARLLAIEIVDVRIAAVGEDPALNQVGFDARRGIAERAGPGLDDALVLLLLELLDERRPLDRPELGADADGQQIVDRDLAHVGV